MTTTLATLNQRVAEYQNDWIEVVVTTAIAANTSIISTNLRVYDGASDDCFSGWYVYITDKANAGVERQISDYATATGTITVFGANLTTDSSNLATIDVSRYSRENRVKAINRSIEEVYPSLHKRLEDITLIEGNWLPNAHFEDWDVSTVPNKYTLSNCAAVKTSTSGLHRGGVSSAKITDTSADGYLYITSDDYPHLLDLMGKTISFKCWAYPSAANDAFLTIYTIKPDGTTSQTLNSTTTCPAARWTLLELENQAINDDIEEIQFRFRVHTNTPSYAYFDDARVTGESVNEYLMPLAARNGTVSQVFTQTSGYSDDMCDDLKPMDWARHFQYDIKDDGIDSYLVLPLGSTGAGRIKLLGTTQLEALSSDTNTISLNAGGQLDALIAYVAYWLMKTTARPVSSEDRNRFRTDMADSYSEYLRLISKHRMASPSGTLRGL